MDKRGQSTLEYFVLAAVIIAGLVAMQVYIKRGMQGRLRDSADNMGQGFFYSPGATNSDAQIITTSKETTNLYSKDSPLDEDYTESTSETELESTRVTSRTEEVSSYAAEPKR